MANLLKKIGEMSNSELGQLIGDSISDPKVRLQNIESELKKLNLNIEKLVKTLEPKK